MDILSDTCLINYFGKCNNLSTVTISPLCLQKGKTKLALYGLSHIKDERLSRLFRKGKVQMLCNKDSDEWFNLLVLHQNRAANRGHNNFIPETVLPSFLDLVIWGHEHDCLIDPTESENGVFISQPGSTVATSLAYGESLEKHIGLLQIYENKFNMQKIKLKTVRPFIFRSIDLKVEEKQNMQEDTQRRIFEEVENMLEEAKEKETATPMLPLIRLNVNLEHEGQCFNTIKFGQEFIEKVANPSDMVKLSIKRVRQYLNKKTNFDNVDLSEEDSFESVEHYFAEYFKQNSNELVVLSVNGMQKAISRFVNQGDTDSIGDLFNYQMQKTQEELEKLEVDTPDKVEDALFYLKNQRAVKTENEELERLFSDTNRRTSDDVTAIVDSDDDVSDAHMSTSSIRRGNAVSPGSTRPTRGRGSRGPRRARGSRARAR